MNNLANKYRPTKFEDVRAQDASTGILKSQLQQGDYRNAYLFCGGAGTGKTTTARIFANEINKGQGNPIEIDAASNNGVDNIRDIIADSKFKSLDSEFKVYIIDEVHMLSIGAFNALLKTLEEPPEGTIFILCTTDPQKIPATILSRVQRFNFKRIRPEVIVSQLAYILEMENEDGFHYTYKKDALEYIAKLADGGMRDAITMLDKVTGYTNEITLSEVQEALDAPDFKVYHDLWKAITGGDSETCLSIIETAHMNGKDLKLFIRNFADFALDICKYQITKNMTLTSLPESEEELLKDCNTNYNTSANLMKSLNKLYADIKWDSNPKTMIQAFMIMACLEEF